METTARTAVYVRLYDLMYQHYEEDRLDEAFELARRLLMDSDLPDGVRASCHMILSTDDEEPFYLEHAQEAVRIFEQDQELMSTAAKQYAEAKRLVEAAKASRQEDQTEAAVQATQGQTQGVQTSPGDDDDMLLTGEEEQWLMPVRSDEPTETRRKKKVRRIDSGHESGEPQISFEEYEKASHSWVALGTAADPAAEDEDVS